MKNKAVVTAEYKAGDSIVVISGEFKDRPGVIQRLGSAGDDVIYLHAQLEGVSTIITLRTFQVQQGSYVA